MPLLMGLLQYHFRNKCNRQPKIIEMNPFLVDEYLPSVEQDNFLAQQHVGDASKPVGKLRIHHLYLFHDFQEVRQHSSGQLNNQVQPKLSKACRRIDNVPKIGWSKSTTIKSI